MSGEIERPENLATAADDGAPGGLSDGSMSALDIFAAGARADQKQIAAWCIDRAEAAEREVGSRGAASYRGQRCEGQASALRALAALLGASR